MRRSLTPERAVKIRKVLAWRQKTVTLVLANIHDPHNVSAIYRSCDAFGVLRVHLYYTHTAFPVLGAKSSASARKWVETVRHSAQESLFEALHGEKMQVLSSSCSPAARPFRAYDYSKPTAIILGNEHGGVDQDLLERSHGEVYIPMYGMIQSFNVSVAAALFLSEITRQRESAGFYDQAGLEEAELERLFSEWAQK